MPWDALKPVKRVQLDLVEQTKPTGIIERQDDEMFNFGLVMRIQQTQKITAGYKIRAAIIHGQTILATDELDTKGVLSSKGVRGFYSSKIGFGFFVETFNFSYEKCLKCIKIFERL